MVQWKMSRIAILDTKIHPGHLRCKKFYSYSVCGEPEKEQAQETSHGTVCARVLDYFTSDYELYNIQILKNRRNTDEKPMGEILHLKKGMQLCLELDVDIVCMSAVSSFLSDSNVLYETAKELSQKSILLAALDNKRYMTVPASYPFVTGVQSDIKDCLAPGELAYNAIDLFGAGMYANCKIGLLFELSCVPSNSFAVPAAAARFNTWKNKGSHIEMELENLRPYPAYGIDEEITFKREQGFYKELPLAVFYVTKEADVYAVCQRAMDELYNKYFVQSSVLCNMKSGTDIRFRKLESIANLKQELLFMECCYKTDLLFLMVEEHNREQVRMQVEADLEITLHGDRIKILSEEGCVKGGAKDLSDLVYQILQ